jgi:hypothetical protein
LYALSLELHMAAQRRILFPLYSYTLTPEYSDLA